MSGGEKSSEPTMEEGAKGAAAAVVPAVSPPPVESRTTGGSPAKEAASPEVDKATSTLGSTELTETVVEGKGEELAGKAIEVEPPLEAAAGTPEPLPADSKKQPQSAGSVKDDAAGEDLAEEFSDFGDSDEDILNQEDEKESRPVSRISGKSSRSAKEEALSSGAEGGGGWKGGPRGRHRTFVQWDGRRAAADTRRTCNRRWPRGVGCRS